MKPLHKYFSSIVKNQLPVFYQQYGEHFVNFLYAYYQWMDQEGQFNNILRNLPEYDDIDLTTDEFLEHFRTKYLINVQLTNADAIRKLIKFSRDVYDSKGSERSFQLLFQILYNDKISVSYPDDRVLKASHGEWFKPNYLELEVSDASKDLVGKQVIGSISGSTAFVEKFVRREINGRYFDVLYVSNPVGRFIRGEQIVISNVLITNPPKMFGSLSFVTVTDGGSNNIIGDIFKASSNTGRGGLVRVTSTANATGRVDFQLVDGGFGYTLNGETTISEFVLGANNFSNTPFTQFEQVRQDLANISFFGIANTFTPSMFVTGYNGPTVVANGYVIQSTTTNSTYGNMKVQVESGSFATATDVKSTGNTSNGIVDIYGDVDATANLIGFSSNALGIVNSVNTFYTLETGVTFVRGETSNATANTFNKSLGSGADFDIGSITDTETLFLFTDLLRQRNTGNILYMDMFISGQGANIGFVQGVTIGKDVAYTPLFGFTETFTNTEIVEQVVISNGVGYSGTVEVEADSLLVVGTGTSFRLKIADTEYIQIANSTAWDIIPTTSVANDTQIWLKRASRVFGTGLSYGKAITVSRAENFSANTTVIRTAELDGTLTTANFIFGTTSTSLANVDTITILGGTGYDNATSVVTFANGTPTVVATANITTNSTGGITSVNMDNNGNGYDFDANVAISVGSGANLKVVMDFGYGFPKDPQADVTNIMKDALASNNFTIGTIASIANVNQGSGYNRAPFVVVIEPLIAGYQRYDFIGGVANQIGSWLPGELVTQNVVSNTIQLTYTGLTGNTAFEVGEFLFQGNVSTPSAFGTVNAQNTTVVTLQDVIGTFVTTSNTLTQIHGATSLTTANVSTVANSTVFSLSRGTVIDANATHVRINRTSFNTSFVLNTPIVGFASGTTANLISIAEDTDSTVLGFNANVTANVVVANGVATSVEVIDSGFGFLDNEFIDLVSSEDSQFQLIGFSNINHMGVDEGSFISHRSWLNEAIVHDNDKYQAYSYEINSSLSIDKYEQMIKELLHVAGTRLFGNVNRQTEANVTTTIQSSSITI